MFFRNGKSFSLEYQHRRVNGSFEVFQLEKSCATTHPVPNYNATLTYVDPFHQTRTMTSDNSDLYKVLDPEKVLKIGPFKEFHDNLTECCEFFRSNIEPIPVFLDTIQDKLDALKEDCTKDFHVDRSNQSVIGECK